ncbi:MAG: hypothetical protein R2932_08030 [Caldilineaceae bacterium]
MAEPTFLTELTETVLAGAKYRAITPDLVRIIGTQELAKRNNLKAAIKATKNKLHQITGAYWQGKPAYEDWLTFLRATGATADTPDEKLLHTTCRTLMAHHASTRERLPILRDFYSILLAGLPPIHTVLDLACGLNPLTIPWMNLAADARYYACDVNQEQMNFLQQALPLLGVAGEAVVCDLLQEVPQQPVDVAFLLKTIPCLEQVDRTIGRRLLTHINATVVFVSFPAQSLGGRNKGMADSYSGHFAMLLNEIGQTQWQVEQFVFATEIVFRLTKNR